MKIGINVVPHQSFHAASSKYPAKIKKKSSQNSCGCESCGRLDAKYSAEIMHTFMAEKQVV